MAKYLQAEAEEITNAFTDKSESNVVLAKNYQGKHKDESATQSLARILERKSLFTLAK